ncbi:hypothetical protein J2T19_000190 [Paenibacillus tundrae]|uniref:Uncharacterized protein n=1 Tax=Paenibacillus tundrae TaxID=528187 RepID=A0ABT9W671_9BACL|nr:hypothetical protein [Paenibacillus tundrae]
MNKRMFAAGKRVGGRSYIRVAGGVWVEVKAEETDEKAR